MTEPVLNLRGVRKAFPGVVALDAVDFTARRGEVHALMGENGAGKSTLIKVLTGAYRRDGGEVKQLFAVMRKLKAEGLGIIFVTHFLDQVYAVSDRITVLRNGKLVGEYPTVELPRRQLIAKMMGRELAEFEEVGHKPEPA